MRHRLVIAVILGMIGSVLDAEEWTLQPRNDFPVQPIFRPIRTEQKKSRFSLARQRSNPFGLKLVVASGEDVVEFAPPIIARERNAPVAEDTAGHAQIQDLEVFNNEPEADDLPPLTSVPTPPSKRAVPLDGALRDEDESEPEDEKKPATGRSSFGWLAGTNNSLGMFELDFEPLSRVKYDALGRSQKDALINSESFTLHVDNSFGARWLNGPQSPDLPPYLFNILIDVETTYRMNDRVAISGLISPGWYTDFSNKGAEAFRLPWHAVSYTKANDEWQWVLGITDLSRQDIRLLPVVGFIYAPGSGDVRWDLVFPKPRVAWRVSEHVKYKNGAITVEQHERWLYLAGELGGGSWAISRADRSYDVVTYRDYRLVAGLENRRSKGHASRLEVGWIFGRAVEYQSNNGNYNPPDTLMIRVSSDY